MMFAIAICGTNTHWFYNVCHRNNKKQHVFVLESTSDLLSLRKHLYSQEKEITFSKDEINTTVREIKKGTGNTLEDDRYIFTETYYQRH